MQDGVSLTITGVEVKEDVEKVIFLLDKELQSDQKVDLKVTVELCIYELRSSFFLESSY